MTITLTRLLRLAVVVTVVAFLASGALRNARHGAALVLGDIAWFGFLAGLLTVIVLGGAVLVRAQKRRRMESRIGA
jgi:hypothetical protein